MQGLRWMGLAAGVVMVLSAAAARADEGIIVQAVGQAKTRATQVDIECTLSADAELAADATVKFRDAKKRALAAIEAMKNADLKVESDGISINNALDSAAQMAMMRGNSTTPGKARVQIQEKNHLVLSNADKLEPEALMETVLKILDVAKDSGYQVGQSPPSNYYEAQLSQFMGNSAVTFRIPDATSLREEAYKAALGDARIKAQKLAELSNLKLGRVISIQETNPSTKADLSGIPNYMAYAMSGVMGKMAAPATDENAISSSAMGKLMKQVNLTVQFEIVK